MGVRLSGEGVDGELLLAEAREGVEGVVGRLGLVVLGVLGGEFVSSLGVGVGFGLVGVLGGRSCTCGAGSGVTSKRGDAGRSSIGGKSSSIISGRTSTSTSPSTSVLSNPLGVLARTPPTPPIPKLRFLRCLIPPPKLIRLTPAPPKNLPPPPPTSPSFSSPLTPAFPGPSPPKSSTLPPTSVFDALLPTDAEPSDTCLLPPTTPPAPEPKPRWGCNELGRRMMERRDGLRCCVCVCVWGGAFSRVGG
jgi:hypothetical protein